MTFTPQLINLGSTANDGTGDAPRAAGTKINANFTTLASLLASGASGGSGGSSGASAPIATPTQPGVIKPDNSTFTVAADGTATALGPVVAALPDISTVGGAQLSDLMTLSRTGSKYKAALSALSGLLGGGGSVGAGGALLTDPRFDGIPYVSLGSAPYNAPLDGLPHTMTQSAALAAYPNCGATGPIAQDTAAWLQAEYDLRTSTVRHKTIIWLPPGSTMVVNKQLWLQNASAVQFHAGSGVTLLTSGCGTTPAIKISNGTRLAVVLRNFQMQAQDNPNGQVQTGGAVWNGYTTGASALLFDNCQGITVENLGLVGYDETFKWGNHVFGVTFLYCAAALNNKGFPYVAVPESSDSMEKIISFCCSWSNNNYGVYLDMKGAAVGTQGGSIFIIGCNLDYNNVRHIYYDGTTDPGARGTNNSVHVAFCHIETTGGFTGTTPRIYANGSFNMSHCELMENDGVIPAGFVEVADGTAASVINCRFHHQEIAIFYSATTGPKIIYEAGNSCQYLGSRLKKLVDGNGISYQQQDSDNKAASIYSDPNPLDGGHFYGKKVINLHYFSGPGNLTLPANDFDSSYFFEVQCWTGPVTITTQPGSSLTIFPAGASAVINPGKRATISRDGTHGWILCVTT